MGDWVVGVDLGATKIALGLIDPADRVVARGRIPTRAEDGPESAVERIAQQIAALRQEAPNGAQVAAVGICTPGPVDHVTGTIIDPPNLGWRNVPFRQMLSDRLGVPVALEHDAKAAALGEFHYGAGRGERSMVFIVVGTGVGAAIVTDGQLYRGLHNTAGEVGHITLDPDGEPCSCGNRGCVETYLSGPWLARRYQRALQRGGQAAPVEESITGETVAAQAQAGDPVAVQVLAEAGGALGAAVATMAMILGVDLYVIGSSVARCGDLLLEPARRAVPHHCYRSVAAQVRIVCTELWDDAPLLGCGWLARQALATSSAP